MTITDAKAYFGLIAGATPSGTNVANNVQIGEALVTRSYASADEVYTFKVAGAAAGNVATWSLDDHTVAQTTGEPVITDGDGNDFEGTALVVAVTLYALMIKVTTSDTTSITIAGTEGLGAVLKLADDTLLLAHSTTGRDNVGTVTITFGTGDGVVECVGLFKD